MRGKRFRDKSTGYIYRVIQYFIDGSMLMKRDGHKQSTFQFEFTFDKEHIKNNMESV